MISIGNKSVPLKLQTHLIGQSMEQQHCLAPGSIDFIPLHRNTGQATQSEIIDCAKLSAVPDVEGGIEDIGFLELVQLDLGVAHLVLHTLEFVIQLQLLPFKLTILPLVPGSSQGDQEGLTVEAAAPLSSFFLRIDSSDIVTSNYTTLYVCH